VAIGLSPGLDAIGQCGRGLTSATGAELSGSDRLGARIDAKLVGGAEGLVDRLCHDRARIGRFLDDQEPLGRRLILKARNAPGVHLWERYLPVVRCAAPRL
jgi:hypothetical protein